MRFRKPFFERYRFAVDRDGDRTLVLIEPLTFMNRSGDVINSITKRFDLVPERLVVVCDNLDLGVGRVRLKRAGGTAGHNGLKSIIAALGDSSFLRMYVGVGRPETGSVVDHVLGKPAPDEAVKIGDAVVRAADALNRLSAEEASAEEVMNELNRGAG